MIKVTLRKKDISQGRLSLYLDFYPAITNPENGKSTRRNFFGMYIYERPKTESQKEHNKETLLIAGDVAAKQQQEVNRENFGFLLEKRKPQSFLTYFSNLVESKHEKSKSTYENWLFVQKYLVSFTEGDCSFSDVTEQLCKDFKTYLLKQEKIGHNTAAIYFDKFKASVRDAHYGKFISENPARTVKSIKPKKTRREYLTEEELKKVAETPLEKYDVIKVAALFSALTGLRHSDIMNLTWRKIRHNPQDGYHICYEQQKTGSLETHFICDEAVELLGVGGAEDDVVLPTLNYAKTATKIPEWIKKAGIKRELRFTAFGTLMQQFSLLKGLIFTC